VAGWKTWTKESAVRCETFDDALAHHLEDVAWTQLLQQWSSLPSNCGHCLAWDKYVQILQLPIYSFEPNVNSLGAGLVLE
jgi:hypothetical protein